jgi:asparagine synthase (glutamine-hydrolysing)
MCGIAGAIRRIPGHGELPRPHSPKIAGFVEKISEAERHRGPDGSGLWQSSGQEVIFGHRRLAILDLSDAGAQPMIDADSGCAITFNGEIYNFLEIRRDLESLGETFSSSCDTEVILTAYKRWGVDAVKRFRGIFALALWDPCARAVYLVRDPMGIKPLYWTTIHDNDTGEEIVMFASEVRALLASGAVRRLLDPAAIASYLWHGFVVGPHTIIDGVHLLPAATILSIQPGAGSGGQNSLELRQYWHMPSSGDRRTTVDALREELLNTVKMQLVSDVPLGVFLSGGVDSSAVAAVASDVAPDAVHTFTIGFEECAYDETRYALQVANAIHSHHTCVVLTEQTFREQLTDAFTAIDQPTFDGLNTYFVSRAARNAGMTVALAGTGGDELFGGYRSYVEIPRMTRIGTRLLTAGNGDILERTFSGAIDLVARVTSELYWTVLGVAPPQTRWGKWADVARVAHDTLGLYQVSYALFTRETQTALAGRAIRAAQADQEHGLPQHVAGAWRQRIEDSELLHAISVLELSSFIGERLLRETDAASMAVALEVRVPLLDHVVAEAVAGVDPARRFFPIREKQVLRDVALGKLDPALFDRPKAGFVLPIDTWARRSLVPRMEAVFADPERSRSVGLQGGPVQMLWRSFVDGRPGLYWSRIWALYVLMSWCQTHDVHVGP